VAPAGFVRLFDFRFDRYDAERRRVVLETRRDAAGAVHETDWSQRRAAEGVPATVTIVGQPDPHDRLMIAVRLEGPYAGLRVSLWAEAAHEAPVFRGVARAALVGTSGCITPPVRCRVLAGDVASCGVGRYEIVWNWKCEFNGVTYDAGTTCFTLYVVLAEPSGAGPWYQPPAAIAGGDIPWTAALDWACTWAQGATAIEDAAAKITREVFALGTPSRTSSGLARFRYGNTNEFVCGETLEIFRLTAMLETLARPAGCGEPPVACMDCASLVSTFCNVLGGDAVVKRIVPVDAGNLDANIVMLIGGEVEVPRFRTHQVVCLESTQSVFDGCLAIDAMPPPGQPPDLWQSPANLKLIDGRGSGYLERLLHDPLKVNVGDVPLRSLDAPPWTGARLDPFVQELRAAYAGQAPRGSDELFQPSVRLPTGPLAGMDNVFVRQAPADEAPWPAARGRWADAETQTAMDVTLAVHDTADGARTHATYEMARDDGGFVVASPDIAEGLVTFVNVHAGHTVNLRGNAVMVIRNVGRRRFDPLDVLRTLSAQLL
jgi:hypothetical protein